LAQKRRNEQLPRDDARGEAGGAMAEMTAPIPAPSWLRVAGNSYVIAVAVTVALILIGSIVFPENSELALFLFDHSSTSFFAPVYPFTIQNALYVMMAIGLADVWTRHVATQRERFYLRQHLLPEGDAEILQIEDLGPIRLKVAALKADDQSFLPQLVDLSILQLFTSKSLDQTVQIFTSTLELMSHRVDLHYQTIRFLVWIIPTTGFIGTVVGISIALEGMRDPKNIAFSQVTAGLAVAFYTTILALLLSAVLVFLQNIVQRREEATLNRAAQYCLRNLINRIYTGD
jgi:biopolymer transport protein ExbB/TolQ